MKLPFAGLACKRAACPHASGFWHYASTQSEEVQKGGGATAVFAVVHYDLLLDVGTRVSLLVTSWRPNFVHRFLSMGIF